MTEHERAIIRATLEAAAKVCDQRKVEHAEWYSRYGPNMSPVEIEAMSCAANIRAIDPATIPVPAQEPVAYLYLVDEGDGLSCRLVSLCPRNQPLEEGWTETPLYAGEVTRETK